jgi:hypothetical protein
VLSINANIFRRHLIKISFFISILFHLLLFLMYNLFGSLQLFPVKINDLLNKPKDEEKRLVFELVETPESARSKTPPQNAQLLSDKNAVARDDYQKNDRPAGNPYSEGDFDVKELPVVPVEPKPLTEQTAEQKDERSKEKRLTEVSSNRYEYQKFSRQELLKKNPSVTDYQDQRRLDRPLYDNKQFSAEDLGGLSFNTYDWDFAPYMLEMKRKVERNVFPPPAFTRMGLISGETLLRFKVMPNGEVKDLVVLKYTGHESLKETSVNAIVNSSRFRPLPADFPEDYLEVTASFTYYVKR